MIPTKIIPRLTYYKSAFCSFVGYSPNLYSGLEYCGFAINLLSNPGFFQSTSIVLFAVGLPN